MADAVVDEPDYSNISKWKVSELKRELSNLGLPTKGKKEELVARLEKQLQVQEEEILNEVSEDVDAADDVEPEATPAEETVAETTNAGVEDKSSTIESVTKTDMPSVETDKMQHVQETVQDIPRASVHSVAAPTSGKMFTNSEEERKLVRARRFGLKSEDMKKEERAKRFNLPPSESEKKAMRAQRFGISNTSAKSSASSTSTSSLPHDIEVLKKRAARFGGTVISPVLQKTEAEEALKRRRERFGPVDTVEAKRQKRAERFGLASS